MVLGSVFYSNTYWTVSLPTYEFDFMQSFNQFAMPKYTNWPILLSCPSIFTILYLDFVVFKNVFENFGIVGSNWALKILSNLFRNFWLYAIFYCPLSQLIDFWISHQLIVISFLKIDFILVATCLSFILASIRWIIFNFIVEIFSFQ